MKKSKAVPMNKIGIRGRILLYLVLFVAFVIVLLWLFQIVFLDSFYQQYRTRQIMSLGEEITSLLGSEDLEKQAEEMAIRSDACILLLDGEGRELLSVHEESACLIHKMSRGALNRWRTRAAEAEEPVTSLFSLRQNARERVLSEAEPAGSGNSLPTASPLPHETVPGGTDSPNENSAAGSHDNSGEGAVPGREDIMPPSRSDGRMQRGEPQTFGFRHSDLQTTNALTLLYARKVTLSDGTAGTLLLDTQITPVASTVSALRLQLIIITMIVLVMAILLAVYIASRVSRPIIETNEAAKALSKAQYKRPHHADGYHEISELNDTLEKAAAALGQVDKLQHELVANISHDLRTPLTMIGGYAEVMRDIPQENKPENMQIIIDETARLSTLVNELLDFSRMQAGSVGMDPKPFCLTAAVEAIVSRVNKMVAKDGYVVRFEKDEETWATADENRIEQVVYNLIGNALTYTGEDKTVTVRQLTGKSNVRIEISDTGKGISEEELPLIWNRYYRTKETHKRAVIGSGLGLNIVQSILEHHSAEYGVKSEMGKGSTFWFALPTCRKTEESA